MIYINYPDGRQPPRRWTAKAEELTAELKAAVDKAARDRIIEQNARVWGEIKGWLEGFSRGKCWFSEARACCSYWHVEHFRPKKEAKQPDRDGYWWLAFDYLNYRLCGSVTNSKKGCYFPLKPGTLPALSPDDNCDDEASLLIDPTRVSDVSLIVVVEGGEVKPVFPEGTWEWERADKSIERYKLNKHTALRRGRAHMWNQCRQKVDQLMVLVADREKAHNAGKYSPTRQEQIKTLCREIRAMSSPRAEFSSAARAFLLQHKLSWVRSLIE